MSSEGQVAHPNPGCKSIDEIRRDHEDAEVRLQKCGPDPLKPIPVFINGCLNPEQFGNQRRETQRDHQREHPDKAEDSKDFRDHSASINSEDEVKDHVKLNPCAQPLSKPNFRRKSILDGSKPEKIGKRTTMAPISSPHHGTEIESMIRTRLYLQVGPSWKSLVSLFKAIHEGEQPSSKQAWMEEGASAILETSLHDEKRDTRVNYIATYFAVLEAMRDSPWDRCEEALMGLRKLLVLEDVRWA